MSVLQKATTALSTRPALTSRVAFAACLWNVQRITASQEIRKYLLFQDQAVFSWQDLLSVTPLLTEHRAVSSKYVSCWQAYPMFFTHRSGFFLMLLFLRKRCSLKKCHVSVDCTITIPRAMSRYSLSGSLAGSLIGGLHSALKSLAFISEPHIVFPYFHTSAKGFFFAPPLNSQVTVLLQSIARMSYF